MTDEPTRPRAVPDEMAHGDVLRAAYARAVAARTAGDRARCPDPDALHDAVRRAGPERRRLETLDHAMGCAACRGELELLRAIEVGRRRTAEEGVRRVRWYRPLAIGLAASLLLAIAVGPGRLWWAAMGPDTTRSADEGGEVALLAPAADARVGAGAALTLVWRPVPGAVRYTVDVLAPDGAVRASVATADTVAVLAPATLRPGAHRWLVRATTAAGERRSAARRLRVADARPAPDA